jgi:hypothetical protein
VASIKDLLRLRMATKTLAIHAPFAEAWTELERTPDSDENCLKGWCERSNDETRDHHGDPKSWRA